MLDRIDQTIVAISSAPGFGALGIVRMSGPQSLAIAEALCGPMPAQGSRRIRADVRIDDAAFPAIIYVFRAPRSYTRQDMVEIHTVGSPAVLELFQQKIILLGAAPAGPGEFTARAFFHGQLSLVQAESVARLIRATDDTQLRAARKIMEGAWSERLVEVRNQLARLLGLVEAGIDFADEPIEFISPHELESRMGELIATLADVERGGGDRELLDQRPRVLLCGPPNAGKSSLMNRLSGTHRAIIAPIAGTTRDLLSAEVDLGGQAVVLLDAAGMDDSPDEVIRAAQAMVATAAAGVDVVCVVLDARALWTQLRWASEGAAAAGSTKVADLWNLPGGLGAKAHLVALNKSDLLDADQRAQVAALFPQDVPVTVCSALTGEGIGDLRSLLRTLIQKRPAAVMEEAAGFTERQRTAIRLAMQSLGRAAEIAHGSGSTAEHAEMLAFELRESLDALGAVTGDVTTEDLLTEIFANFCIGK